ncbi:hypothetical protein GSI_02302 [Ganoderma sinense ZZ0214-1]|uniref:Uncharacterized protein n=1 Tax=Ganoderma sinense ZZ0214-1 TaxID=1077348 RepID=A0A2G8SP75_9APHY|nr:hypothetical protein GSI_02302 [Ganoderma sinense ZZ0214-1]
MSSNDIVPPIFISLSGHHVPAPPANAPYIPSPVEAKYRRSCHGGLPGPAEGAGKPSPPAVIMIGVSPDSVSAKLGLQVGVQCRSILLGQQIEDVHVIVYESKYRLLASMYKPVITANPVAIVCEPFSTTLGIPICDAKTTSIEGTGGTFFPDITKPGKLFLLTARHVLFH